MPRSMIDEDIVGTKEWLGRSRAYTFRPFTNSSIISPESSKIIRKNETKWNSVFFKSEIVTRKIQLASQLARAKAGNVTK